MEWGREEDRKSLLKSTVCVLSRLSAGTWLSWDQHILLDSMEDKEEVGVEQAHLGPWRPAPHYLLIGQRESPLPPPCAVTPTPPLQFSHLQSALCSFCLEGTHRCPCHPAYLQITSVQD